MIIMSATLRVADFVENPTLFTTPPPVLTVGARQHPVTIHFARRTDMDYVHAAVRKACRIHARLPPGGILIFLTGQNEITGVCRALETRFGTRALEKRRRRRTSRLSPVGDDQAGYEQVATVAPACGMMIMEVYKRVMLKMIQLLSRQRISTWVILMLSIWPPISMMDKTCLTLKGWTAGTRIRLPQHLALMQRKQMVRDLIYLHSLHC
jgi:hypothetical protein